MEFMELAKQRYSERYFDPRPVEEEKLQKILEAGRIVPTACNYQPQKFYVIRSEEAMAKLRRTTVFHYNAPLIILVCYDMGEVWTNPSDRYYENYNSGELGYPSEKAKANPWHYKRKPIEDFVTEL